MGTVLNYPRIVRSPETPENADGPMPRIQQTLKKRPATDPTVPGN
jgi:hypothetical protein